MKNAELRILIIDDMATMRTRLVNQLNGLGFTKISAAADGQLAWTLLKEKVSEKDAIELVISDWNMPNMTGIELLEKIRGDADLKKLPFIMVTAEGEKSQLIRALNSGVSEYLIKPVDKLVLQEKITAVTKIRN